MNQVTQWPQIAIVRPTRVSQNVSNSCYLEKIPDGVAPCSSRFVFIGQVGKETTCPTDKDPCPLHWCTCVPCPAVGTGKLHLGRKDYFCAKSTERHSKAFVDLSPSTGLLSFESPLESPFWSSPKLNYRWLNWQIDTAMGLGHRDYLQDLGKY